MTKTLRLEATVPGDLDRAAAILRSGGTIAFPTETVYGLGANALDAAAVASIFAAKQRPAWDPLIVHLAAMAQLEDVASIPPELEQRVRLLTEALWPGPLTLLLPRSPAIPDSVTAGRPLVGLRIPAHPVAQHLLKLTALPIAAPSANTFGHTSPTTAAHVLADLYGRIDAVLDGGACTVGVESTVLDPASMTVYRPGAVTFDRLFEVTGIHPQLYIARSPRGAHQSLPSPGVDIRHYAPRARLILIDPPDTGDVTHALLAQNLTFKTTGNAVGLMLPDEWAAVPAAIVFAWGRWDDHEQLARNLFAGLRSLDDRGADVILCPAPQGPGLAQAIRDRLEKAAREA